METKLTDEAVEDVQELTGEQWQEIKSKLEEVTGKLSHRDLKLISNPLLNHPIWQLKVKGENTNHRAYLDVEGSKIVVIAIWNFEFTHQGDQHWKELENRV